MALEQVLDRDQAHDLPTDRLCESTTAVVRCSRANRRASWRSVSSGNAVSAAGCPATSAGQGAGAAVEIDKAAGEG